MKRPNPFRRPDWARALTAPAGAVPLIAARCGRCHRVAAKYWEHGEHGAWIAPNRDTDRTVEQLLDDSTRVRNMVADRVCSCDPPPALPDGDELAALVARAKTTDTPGRRHRAPLTIRVV